VKFYPVHQILKKRVDERGNDRTFRKDNKKRKNQQKENYGPQPVSFSEADKLPEFGKDGKTGEEAHIISFFFLCHSEPNGRRICFFIFLDASLRSE
jgi:hypothetical protein